MKKHTSELGDERRSNSSLQVRQQHILDKGHCGEPTTNERGRANGEVNPRYCRAWSLLSHSEDSLSTSAGGGRADDRRQREVTLRGLSHHNETVYCPSETTRSAWDSVDLACHKPRQTKKGVLQSERRWQCPAGGFSNVRGVLAGWRHQSQASAFLPISSVLFICCAL